MSAQSGGSILRQPMSVWATAFAAVVAFMGIGLVDPILPSIAQGLHAGPSQVSLLFTSYFLVTAVAMLVTGWVSSRIGGKRTLLLGLALVVVFAALAGTSGSVGELIGFRAGWGLGNALFVATALAVIVGAASGGAESAIILYEAALGLGISMGPLVGAALGDWNWRAPFFGTASLMAVGFVLIATLLRTTPTPAVKIRLGDPLRALAHGGLSTTAFTAFFYNFAFFTILAFTPFILGMSPYGIGAVFFGWGACVALASVFGAPALQRRLGSVKVLHLSLGVLAALQVGIALSGHAGIVVFVILSGIPIGLNNTVFTEAAMEVSDAPRPVASAGYNFVRWMGGALAPFIATKLGEDVAPALPYVLGALCCLAGMAVLYGRRHHMRSLERVDADHAFRDAPVAA
ncbi:MFS transporter [Streptosporangium roseum]|uniref:Major facilitator superfamily protein MFS_1 n=1 Tax=Streptosporangium roseum (strain ATCC 12428 / DSM 43021 / JCM 3005 / KCTC 9067 / NCIMB 10171 / NRRL 2505 / NI 9100) TaxID=479432 RepID=D2AWS1_STRRD|nr:MFS transporter [Streptosporangium roseum]ACZ88849.1 major facilitator superfamily protein MFS_1 [Streptosporangium roseum DSM 43021]